MLKKKTVLSPPLMPVTVLMTVDIDQRREHAELPSVMLYPVNWTIVHRYYKITTGGRIPLASEIHGLGPGCDRLS